VFRVDRAPEDDFAIQRHMGTSPISIRLRKCAMSMFSTLDPSPIEYPRVGHLFINILLENNLHLLPLPIRERLVDVLLYPIRNPTTQATASTSPLVAFDSLARGLYFDRMSTVHNGSQAAAYAQQPLPSSSPTSSGFMSPELTDSGRSTSPTQSFNTSSTSRPKKSKRASQTVAPNVVSSIINNMYAYPLVLPQEPAFQTRPCES